MEIDEIKKLWSDAPHHDQKKADIMEIIQHKTYGPLEALKNTYRKQIVVMCLIPFLLIATNLNNVDHVFSSVLYWAYVAFCIGIILFARYNYNIVKNMQKMDVVVKKNLEQQIGLLEKRANLEIMALRIILLFFVALVEILPYFQHFSMLEKWHSLP